MTLFQILMLGASAFFAFKVYEHIQTLKDPAASPQGGSSSSQFDPEVLVQRADEEFEAGNLQKAFELLKEANAKKAQDADVVIIDTAGRLHNKVNLMAELSKVRRVMEKVIPDAPHEVLLVLDGSTGQNAYEQAKQFSIATQINALAITKLDGTAKGGVVIGISDQMQIPVKYIGVGEGINDLQFFDKEEFVDSFFN